jgi:HPt (histidine-containing phosphotransfer) domain-containing protein
MVPRVFRTFEASLVRVMAQLQDALAAGDAQAVMAMAHTLKSSSASVGALALSVACADVEQRLRSRQPGDLQADIERLSRECSAALTAVRAMLQG